MRKEDQQQESECNDGIGGRHHVDERDNNERLAGLSTEAVDVAIVNARDTCVLPALGT